MTTQTSSPDNATVRLINTPLQQKMEFLTYERYWRFGVLPPYMQFMFCSAMSSVPVEVTEFDQARENYPIVFLDDANDMPHVILGIAPRINLMVNSKGIWRRSHYIPRRLQLYPFGIVEVSDSDADNMFLDSFLNMENQSGSHQKIFLGIDANSPMLVPIQNEPHATHLFEQDGSATPFVKQNMELQSRIKSDHEKTTSFANAMRTHKVLAPRSINLHLKTDDSTVTLDGFSTVSKSALNKVSPATLTRWHELGYMQLIEQMDKSQKNWASLIPLHERRMTRDLLALKLKKK